MSLSYTFKSLAAFLFVLFWGWELSAVPSYPRPIRVEQPDGTTMTVRLYGDERFNYVTTVDGYNLVAETVCSIMRRYRDRNSYLRGYRPMTR